MPIKTTVTVQPSGGALGAEISGVDPSGLDEQSTAAIRAAILEHEVVFFRGVNLSEEQQVSLAEQFGTPSISPVGKLMGQTEPTLQVIADGPGSPPAADDWHTDRTWLAEPPNMAVLQALVVPLRGGDTMWASMTAAFDALSADMQEFCCGLTALHDNEPFIRGVVAKAPERAVEYRLDERLREEYPPVVHPLVRTHPETGKPALLLGGSFMKQIVELRPNESAALIGLLDRHITDPQFHVRWQWASGDVAIWDERSTLHRAVGDSGEQERVIRRVEVGSDAPFFAAA
jgi:taurine dioxygenase